METHSLDLGCARQHPPNSCWASGKGGGSEGHRQSRFECCLGRTGRKERGHKASNRGPWCREGQEDWGEMEE